MLNGTKILLNLRKHVKLFSTDSMFAVHRYKWGDDWESVNEKK